MSLIALAVYDTDDNDRSMMTQATLSSLLRTVDLTRHRVVVVDNASCAKTHAIYQDFPEFQYIYNERNLGTAEAINLAWRQRRPGEHAVKMDNDVVIHVENWADILEDALAREKVWNTMRGMWEQNKIGILGLKRKDLPEAPWRTDWAHSEICRLSHAPGQRWLDVERVGHVIGTCQMYSSALLDVIGYLYQPTLYGFDDALAAARCKGAGFWSAFLPGIEIDHIDPGGTDYTEWKRREADRAWGQVQALGREMEKGINIYYNPFE